MQVKAMVWDGVGRPGRLEEVTLDPPGPGEALVKVVAAGVCHSDLHLASGHLGKNRFPTVLGHEGAGIVEALGEGVSGLEIGDRVSFCFIPACRVCAACRRGQPNLCAAGTKAAFAGTMLDGTHRLHQADGTPIQHFLTVACFAERTVVPRQSLVPLGSDLPLWQASLLGCAVVTGHGAINNAARLRPGDSVCVVGCGGVGLQVIAAARLGEAGEIAAVDPSEERRRLAVQHGAQRAMAPEEAEGSFDVSVEAVGRPESIALAWRLTREGGTTVVVGLAPRGVDFSLPAIELSDDKTLRGSFYGSGDPSVEIAQLAEKVRKGELDLSATVTHTALLDGVEEAFERMTQAKGGRTVLLIDEELSGWV